MILVIDDDAAIRTSLSLLLKRAGYAVATAAKPKEATGFVRQEAPELMLMDMNFSLSTSGDEGLTLLKQMKLLQPDVPVILMTAWGSIELAVKGMQAGAFDFITKPWNNAALLARIHTALELNAPEQDSPDDTQPGFDRSFIIGQSPALLDVLHIVHRIAPTNASVLITGESGTGKELIAEALHRNSLRSKQLFVKVNLGGISQSLFESEMFGYRKGAFTDALTDHKGRFELADKGTIFLDEIGDLDTGSQVKLLRVLQDQTYEPLGDSRPHQLDIRVICATNADLKEKIQHGLFREDLYYRINLIHIHLPALRERREDIPLLARHFMARLAEDNHLPPATLSPDAEDYLMALPLPGNVRQLKNIVERTLLISAHTVLTASDFRLYGDSGSDSSGPETPSAADSSGNCTLDDIERLAIGKAMARCQGNISQAAQELGISRAALYRRLEKYGYEKQKES